MSIDKLICVVVPLRVNQILTPSNARIVTTVILAVASLFSTYELFSQKSVMMRVKNRKGPIAAEEVIIMNGTADQEYSVYIGYDCDTKWPEW